MSDSSDISIAEFRELSTPYWVEARRPWPTLLFVLPLILTYEAGVQFLPANPLALRNGADCWLRAWMLNAGFVFAWALPALLIGGLLVWHLVGRYSWRCSIDTLTGMLGESLLFALLLVICGQSLNLLFRGWGLPTLAAGAASPASAPPGAMVRAISFVGAGVYEELMFRLALIPLVFYLLRALLLPRGLSIVLAVSGSSLLFAAAHYLDPSASLSASGLRDALATVAHDPGLWYGFCFRLFAGFSFSMLLLFRGFGITVGCHTIYDLLAGILMQAPAAVVGWPG